MTKDLNQGATVCKNKDLPSSLDEYLNIKGWDGKIEESPEVDFGQPKGEELWP